MSIHTMAGNADQFESDLHRPYTSAEDEAIRIAFMEHIKTRRAQQHEVALLESPFLSREALHVYRILNSHPTEPSMCENEIACLDILHLQAENCADAEVQKAARDTARLYFCLYPESNQACANMRTHRPAMAATVIDPTPGRERIESCRKVIHVICCRLRSAFFARALVAAISEELELKMCFVVPFGSYRSFDYYIFDLDCKIRQYGCSGADVEFLKDEAKIMEQVILHSEFAVSLSSAGHPWGKCARWMGYAIAAGACTSSLKLITALKILKQRLQRSELSSRDVTDVRLGIKSLQQAHRGSQGDGKRLLNIGGVLLSERFDQYHERYALELADAAARAREARKEE